MTKPKEKICIQCERSLPRRDNFYKYKFGKYYDMCKSCICKNRKIDRDGGILTERRCGGCGEEERTIE